MYVCVCVCVSYCMLVYISGMCPVYLNGSGSYLSSTFKQHIFFQVTWTSSHTETFQSFCRCRINRGNKTFCPVALAGLCWTHGVATGRNSRAEWGGRSGRESETQTSAVAKPDFRWQVGELRLVQIGALNLSSYYKGGEFLNSSDSMTNRLMNH